jgi:two-component system response regulator (stage 0 sporulation protein F)
MRKKVLVVDDELDICDLLQDQFEEYGFDVEVCDDGSAALERVATGDIPDIVISDVKMPTNGMDVLKTIKDQKLGVDNFYFFTGYNHLSKTEASILGADGLFHKPFELDELIKSVSCEAY